MEGAGNSWEKEWMMLEWMNRRVNDNPGSELVNNAAVNEPMNDNPDNEAAKEYHMIKWKYVACALSKRLGWQICIKSIK